MSISRRLQTTNRFPIFSYRCAPLKTHRVLLVRRSIQTRRYSQSHSDAGGSWFLGRAPLALRILLLAGIGALGYGAYDIYSKMTLWPEEVRSDLRAGLRAKHRGDLELCEKYLQRAWENTKSLPVEKFKAEPYLKTSGIAIALANVLEEGGKLERAYGVYLDALNALLEGGTNASRSGPENLRGIAISYKLAEIAAQLNKPEEEEEHLVWAVTTILKSVLRLSEHPEGATTPQSAGRETPINHDAQTMISELSLPEWATRNDVASPLEALGALYTQAGRTDYAMPLYLQAISILIPPLPQISSREDRCRGAQLMSNMSELTIRSQPKLTEETLNQAETWAKTGLGVVERARESSREQEPACELALAVALFNVAALRRMAGDKEEAKRLFLLSLKQSKMIKLQTGIEHAEEALRHMGELSTDPPNPQT